MSAITKVIFYNTFWNKKIPNGTGSQAINSYWPGLDWNPTGYPTYPNLMTLNATNNQWVIEESRIYGGYNNTQNEIGVQAFLNETEITQRHRFNSLIYSGVYNNTTGVNQTNVFSTADSITKSIEPSYGFIKKTQSSSSNMIIFQENKVSQALIDKDTIYTSEDGTATSPPGVVLGQVIPYAGDFGIGCNPESFARFGRRKYFADPYRGSVLRLSNDGLTEISRNGMQDFFRDELQKISCSNKFLYYTLQTSQVTGALNTGVGVLTSSITQNTSTATLTGTNITATYTCSNPNASGAEINIDVGSGEVSAVTVDLPGVGYQVGNTITIPKSFLGGLTDVIITLTAGDVGVGPSNIIPFTLAGTDPMGDIRIGMLASIQQTNGSYLDVDAYVTDVSYVSPYSVTLSKAVTLTGGTTGSKSSIKFSMPVKDKIVGGWDIYDRTYVISLQQWNVTANGFPQNYKTLTYDETVAGWNSFYTYKPSNIFSLKNNFLTTFEGGLWKHHDNSVINNRGNFYGSYSSSYVDFIFNQNPSTKKIFQTINYEGDNGFKISRYTSDLQGVDPDLPLTSPNNYSLNNQYQDRASNPIRSYDEGLYTDPITGQPKRAGFNRKENLYTANLINNSTVRPNEVIFGNNISGIKGYFATVKIETDSTTDLGGAKEIWSVGTKIIRSS